MRERTRSSLWRVADATDKVEAAVARGLRGRRRRSMSLRDTESPGSLFSLESQKRKEAWNG
jgi:hypothetical protein